MGISIDPVDSIEDSAIDKRLLRLAGFSSLFVIIFGGLCRAFGSKAKGIKQLIRFITPPKR
jgi:hypothetical protein